MRVGVTPSRTSKSKPNSSDQTSTRPIRVCGQSAPGENQSRKLAGLRRSQPQRSQPIGRSPQPPPAQRHHPGRSSLGHSQPQHETEAHRSGGQQAGGDAGSDPDNLNSLEPTADQPEQGDRFQPGRDRIGKCQSPMGSPTEPEEEP